jgi:hypothetical protein
MAIDTVTKMHAEMDDIASGYEAESHCRAAIMEVAARFPEGEWDKLDDDQQRDVVYFAIGVAREAYLRGQLAGIDDMALKLARMREEAA